jgi:hypothetical protein
MTLVLAENSMPGGMPSAMHVPTVLKIPGELPTAEDFRLDRAMLNAIRDCNAGSISEVELDRILASIDAERRTIARGAPPADGIRPINATQAVRRLFARRRYRRSPDRPKSHERRARLAADYDAIPPQIRCLFKEAGAAVLAIMAYEHQSKGHCELHVEAIAAEAGVCVRTVQNTRKRAAELGLIRFLERPVTDASGRRIAKSKTNLIEIVAVDWLNHLANRRTGTGCKTVTERKILQATKIKEAFEGSKRQGPRVLRIFRVSG